MPAFSVKHQAEKPDEEASNLCLVVYELTDRVPLKCH